MKTAFHQCRQRPASWIYAQEDPKAIARRLVERKPVDAVFSLARSGELDALFRFLEESGFLDLLKETQLEGVKRRCGIPDGQLLLLYLVKAWAGVASIRSVPALLFSNLGTMRWVGLNAYCLEQGLTRRSQDRRQQNSDRELPKPFSRDLLADTVARMSPTEALSLYQAGIRGLARRGLFGKRVWVVMDGSHLATNAWFPVSERDGFKIVALYELSSGVPIACLWVPVHSAESDFVLALLEQARDNLDGRAQIVGFLGDRAYVDGKVLSVLDDQGLVFVVRCKEKMAVGHDARGLAQALIEQVGGSSLVRVDPGGHLAYRVERFRHGQGKRARIKKRRTELVGFEGLISYDDYNDPELAKGKGRKDYVPKPLQAVVVLKWRGQVQKAGEQEVYLTNGSVEDPFGPFDSYDQRSTIENRLFREVKEAWHLEKPPRYTEHAYQAHVYLTLLAMAMATAQQVQGLEREAPDASAWAGPPPKVVGARRWRRGHNANVQEQVIVFSGQQ